VKTYPRFAVLVLSSLALATTACQLPVFFPEFLVNTSGPGNNASDDVAIGEDGECIVVWSEFAADGEVLGRRFDPLTAPLGGPFPVNAVTTNDQGDASVAKDAEGRFVAVWSDENTQIWGRRFEADGTPLGGNFQVSTSTLLNTTYPHVASDPSGNFVVAWTASTAAGVVGGEVMARRFDSNGAPLGDEFPVNQISAGIQRAGGAAMSPAGFVVSWGGAGDGISNGIFARLFDPSGNPITDDLNVEVSLTTTQTRPPDVAMNANGEFVVVWDDGDATTFAVSGRRWSADGTPASDAFLISQGTLDARDPRVTSDSAGNFLVSWLGLFDPPEIPEGPSAASGFPVPTVNARLYDIGGFPVSSQFAVNDFTTDFKFRARPSLTDDASFVIAWTSSAGKGANEVKARKTAVRAAPAIVMDPNEALSSPAGGSGLGNGVFEPGETQVPRTAWVNDSGADVLSVAGSAPQFIGPAGAVYTINDNAALYDTIPAGQTKSCIAAGNCYSVTVSDPAVRPVQHWDALLQETLNLSLPHTWVIHLGESFPDVPTGHQFYPFIENLFHNGVTTGCAGGGYCPGDPVTRAQMAVFLLKSKFGSAHIPPPCTGTVFTDVPCTGGPFDPWIEELAALQITGGCGGTNYCPGNTVTRQQMAVFLLKALEGSSYDPPDCAGIFDDVPCTPGTGFSDWIEELYDRGITGGCSVAPLEYCPTNPNNRGQMAVFLVKTFGLVLYGG